MSARKVLQKWSFNSTSNPNRLPYEVLQWTDYTLSCNCPAWTHRFKDGKRSCKHVRGVLVTLQAQSGKVELPVAPMQVTPPKIAQATLALHKRKLRWD